jgi:hypothetical protein
MDLRRLRTGEWIAGASGLVLFVSLFLPWYRVESTPAVDITAFEAFSVFDIMLVVAAAAGMAVLVVMAVQETPAVGVAVEALVTIVGGVIAILLLFRVLNVPGELEVAAGQPFETVRTPAAWIGLAAAFGVFTGSLVAMRDERLSEPGRLTDATGLPVESQPEVETLPAP